MFLKFLQTYPFFSGHVYKSEGKSSIQRVRVFLFHFYLPIENVRKMLNLKFSNHQMLGDLA